MGKRAFILALTVVLGAAGLPLPAAAAPSCLGKRATIVGTPGADAIRVKNNAVVAALAGADTITGSANNVTICGDRDADVIDVSGRAIRAVGGAGNDRIAVGSAATMERANILIGGGGRDLLVGGKGVDSMVGNGGRDELRGRGGHDSIWGGPGHDILYGHAGDDRLIGDAGNDLLIGGGGRDLLDGRIGNDNLRGSGGQDFLLPGPGTDQVLGQAGRDFVSYDGLREAVEVDLAAGRVTGGTDDRLYSIERVEGTKHADLISGSSGHDDLFGARGDDTLLGLAGDDVLVGGPDADVVDGGTGTDLASFNGMTFGVRADLGTGKAQAVRSSEGSDVLRDIEDLEGSKGPDLLIGDASDNRLFGGDDGDRLEGLGGTDVLEGEAGRDQLYGGEGDDWLDGGLGFDILDGGPGTDTCVNGEDETNCGGDSDTSPVAPVDDSDLPTLSASVALQADPSHSGVLAGVGLDLPLELAWSVTLGKRVSYPVIGDGLVFVTTGRADFSEVELHALAAATGRRIWTRVFEDEGPVVHAAYSDGLVFLQRQSGILSAFTAATGDLVWSLELPFERNSTSPPTAHDGVVYTTGEGNGGILYAVDAATGEVLWARSAPTGERSSPTLSSASVFVSYRCTGPYAFLRTNGARLWAHPDRCTGVGGSTTVYDAGRLYVGTGPRAVLDAQTGELLETVPSIRPPAALDGDSYSVVRDGLVARDPSGAIRWTFTSYNDRPVEVVSAPLVVDSHVFIGGPHGDMFVLRTADGTLVDVHDFGSGGVAETDEHNRGAPVSGFGAGEGLLFVPHADKLTAFR